MNSPSKHNQVQLLNTTISIVILARISSAFKEIYQCQYKNKTLTYTFLQANKNQNPNSREQTLHCI